MCKNDGKDDLIQTIIYIVYKASISVHTHVDIAMNHRMETVVHGGFPRKIAGSMRHREDPYGDLGTGPGVQKIPFGDSGTVRENNVEAGWGALSR